ncbi:hypothetical protein [Pedobacter sp. R-06]|uniref:hypothetical protein n=1 Tax=Pedobacter sp. R-06 TaxID=3404051 RepID=UPI003CE83678
MQTNRPLLYLFTALISSVLVLPACGQSNSKKTLEQGDLKSIDSTQTTPKDLNKLLGDLKTSMISYLQTAKPSYTMDDINSCETILKQYLADMLTSKNKKAGMKIVKKTILTLNKLNSKTQETLIETGEREQIAEIIILAASRKGYNSVDEDITEEWRQW